MPRVVVCVDLPYIGFCLENKKFGSKIRKPEKVNTNVRDYQAVGLTLITMLNLFLLVHGAKCRNIIMIECHMIIVRTP